VRFAGARLAITKCRATESLDAHFNNALNARVVQDIFLRGSWLEDHIVGKDAHAVAIVRPLLAHIVAFQLERIR